MFIGLGTQSNTYISASLIVPSAGTFTKMVYTQKSLLTDWTARLYVNGVATTLFVTPGLGTTSASAVGNIVVSDLDTFSVFITDESNNGVATQHAVTLIFEM
jgi:hypothetical protein